MDLKHLIYKNLKKVPKGKVITYKELAKSVNSKAYRYVGQCMKSNEHPETIPCYKVVKSSGEIGKYSASGGLKKKIELLKRDGVVIENGRIDFGKYGHKFK